MDQLAARINAAIEPTQKSFQAKGIAMAFLHDWYERHFSDPHAITLIVVIAVISVTLWFAGGILAPVIASAVMAYLLDWFVTYVERWRIPHLLSVLLVFSIFVTVLLFLAIYLLPLVWNQAAQLVTRLPAIFAAFTTLLETLLALLSENYPALFPDGSVSKLQIRNINESIVEQLVPGAKNILETSVKSVINFITLAVYLILMPLLVFFFMKDKHRIINWVLKFLPPERRLAGEVWQEVNAQIGNYVRGKLIEILIVWVVTYITFALLGLQFAMLLGMVVGLSVLVPYIGATVVTIPVAIIGYAQWGMTTELAYLMIAYAIIQALDGNLLVPILFSEAVDLHPIAIIIAILIFSNLWGFWGLFFAIPLAAIVQAVIKLWPAFRRHDGRTSAQLSET